MTAAESRLTVLLVDDHAVVREGYRRLLENRRSIQVIGEAANAEEAVALFQQTAPDVVVMDIALPGVSGIEAMRRMLKINRNARVLMFSMYEDLIYAERALRAGALGYVTKASAPGVLVDAVFAVSRRRRFLSDEIAREIALREPDDERPVHGLAAREFEILRMLVDGHSPRQIAAQLGLTLKTVVNLQSIIRQKLGVDSPLQLLRAGESLVNRATLPD